MEYIVAILCFVVAGQGWWLCKLSHEFDRRIINISNNSTNRLTFDVAYQRLYERILELQKQTTLEVFEVNYESSGNFASRKFPITDAIAAILKKLDCEFQYFPAHHKLDKIVIKSRKGN